MKTLTALHTLRESCTRIHLSSFYRSLIFLLLCLLLALPAEDSRAYAPQALLIVGDLLPLILQRASS